MSLAPGVRLGAYEIVSLLGSGGMGEVYRARDTRLKREVAVKTLPERSLADPDSLARFQREGELLATLNHPNIAAIYGFEDAGSTHAIVMELVEGSTLAERLAEGPLPLTEALAIARQTAEALEAAHERGVIHRDLKPANVKVTAEGHVKVLDFGLAKLVAPADSAPTALNTMSPTLSAQATLAGVLLGTAAYMSPEQARAKPLDKRTDIWSFGCVLYEMLTGKRAFDGEEITDVLARIIERDPDFDALPEVTPAVIRKLLRRCLEKDRKRRLPDIGVARLDIEEASAAPLSGPVATPSAGADLAPLGRRALPWAIAAAAVIAASIILIPVLTPSPTAPISATQRLTVELGADVSVMTLFEPALALSPDGQTLAFVARPAPDLLAKLYVRRLDRLQAEPLGGTDGARGPFFSPDGQWIGFFADGKLKKVATAGGPAVTLADAPQGRGAVWAEDDTIVFQPIAAQTVGNGALLRVSSAGGTPEPVTALAEGEVTQRYPQVLPGGKAFLFTSNNDNSQGFEDANIVVQSQPGAPHVIVRRGGYYARYLPSGHLAYILNGTLFAAPFDLDRYVLTGEPVPVVEGVATNTAGGFAHYAVSNSGTLVYLPGQTFNNAVPMFWLDRQGKTTALRATPANWSNVQFAPNGRLLAIDVAEAAQTRDVWIYDWGRDASSRLTFDPAADFAPVWTPDSRRIVFSSQRGDKTTANLYWQRADGSDDVQRLTESRNNQYATSWHPNGKLLVFVETIPPNNNDLMILPIEGDEAAGWKPGTPTVFLSSPYRDDAAEFSPDGRWIAYQSNESGSFEVYVRPFPGPGGKWQISNGGGTEPTWSRTRPELVFRGSGGSSMGPGGGSMMVATYTVEGDSFRADKPRALSQIGTLPRPGVGSYALHPDGERFAMARVPDLTTEQQDRLVVIFNFFDELRRIAPPNGPND